MTLVKLFPVLTLLSSWCFLGQIQVDARRSESRRGDRQHQHHELASRMSADERSTTQYKSVGYFVNSGIYAPNFQPTNITASTLTHILYAFANINPSTGVVTLSDLYADQQKKFPGDPASEPGSNLYGCFKQLYLLKKAHRNLKVLLSIGGWSNSQAGQFGFITNASLRAKFVSSAVQLLEDNGLDGIDIDFEYPTAAQAGAFASLLAELQTALAAHASSKGDAVPYEISVAVPAGPANKAPLANYVSAMDKAVSFWNLMTYDYAGDWSTETDYFANIYTGTSKTGIDGYNTVTWYEKQGATKNKLNFGIPLYGRSFENTNGLHQPFNGVGPGGSKFPGSEGIWPAYALPRPGAKVTESTDSLGSYSYDASKKELITYDTVNIVKDKASFIQYSSLGGAMYWDLSSDYGYNKGSLVQAVNSVFGSASNLDQTQNHLYYPQSQFANVKTCMGGCPAGVVPSPCKGVSAWSSKTSYTTGGKVTYENFLWTAKKSTKNNTPGGSANAWTKGASC